MLKYPGKRLTAFAIAPPLMAILLTLSLIGQADLQVWFGGASRIQQFFNTELEHIRYFSQATTLLDFLFNADALYLPALYQDLVVEGGSLSQWSLTPAPYFFPDMTLFFGLNSLLSNPVTTVFAYAAAQLALLGLAIGYSFRSLIPPKHAPQLWASAALTLLTLSLASGYVPELITLFLSSYHGGATLCTMLTLGLTFQWQQQPRSTGIPLTLAGILILATASDLLIVPQLIGPLTIALSLATLLSLQPARMLAIQLSLLISSALTGALLGNSLAPTRILNQHLLTDSTQLIENSQRLVALLQVLAEQSPVYFTGLFATPLLAIIVAIRARQHRQPAQLLAALYILSMLAGSLLLAIVFGKTAPRYLIPLLTLPVFWWLPTQLARLSPAPATFAILITLLSTACLAWLHGLKPLTIPSQYYPADIACVDKNSTALGLKTGLADYWQEKRINLFNQTGIRVLQVTPDLRLRHWINSSRYFQRNDINFIISDQSQSADYRLQLPPQWATSTAWHCKNWTIYVFDTTELTEQISHDPLKQRELLIQQGTPIRIPAAHLPSAIANSQQGSTRVSDHQKGHLTFGPYIPLPEGHYQFEFSLHNTSATSKAGLHWDVTTTSGRTQAAGSWQLNPGVNSRYEASFDISPAADNIPLEIRLFHDGQGQITVGHLKISRDH